MDKVNITGIRFLVIVYPDEVDPPDQIPKGARHVTDGIVYGWDIDLPWDFENQAVLLIPMIVPVLPAIMFIGIVFYPIFINIVQCTNAYPAFPVRMEERIS